jgi:hypothetical protein
MIERLQDLPAGVEGANATQQYGRQHRAIGTASPAEN